jgi:hypothetical protein
MRSFIKGQVQQGHLPEHQSSAGSASNEQLLAPGPVKPRALIEELRSIADAL